MSGLAEIIKHLQAVREEVQAVTAKLTASQRRRHVICRCPLYAFPHREVRVCRELVFDHEDDYGNYICVRRMSKQEAAADDAGVSLTGPL